MKRTILALVCASAALSLVGCATDHMIITQDGTIIETDNRPEIDKKTGLIKYKDHQGRTNQIPQSEVKEIKER